MIGSDNEALRSPDFEGIFPPLGFLFRTDTDDLIHLSTSSKNLSVSREAVADVILHNFRTFHGFDGDQLTSGRVVGMRDNAMLLGVLGRFSISIECFDCFFDVSVRLDNMRIETCGWTVRAGRTAKHAIGGHSCRSGGDSREEGKKKFMSDLDIAYKDKTANKRKRSFTYAAASGSPRATSSSFFLSVFGNKPNMMQLCFGRSSK